MVDFRKIVIIFVIAILFAVLVFSVIEAVYPQPKYEDFCGMDRYGPSVVSTDKSQCKDIQVDPKEKTDCEATKGYIEYEYDPMGCPTSYKCNTCQNDYQIAYDDYRQVVFYVSAVLALIAIFIGLYLPAKEDSLNEWIGTGFMLGGTFALFFGTISSFTALSRFIRPVVILIELVLVIFLAYKKVGNLRKDHKKKR